jgi:hypothetical protein
MASEEIIEWLAIISTFTCLPISVILARRKLHNIDRVFPLLWQCVLWFFIFNSFNHGFPGELFKELVFTIIWALIALVISFRLMKISALLVKIFAWSQIIQAVSLLVLAYSGYASSCWRHYGRIVWNP